MNILCNNCQKSLKVDEKMAGKKGRCSACKQIIEIPNDITQKAERASSQPAPSSASKTTLIQAKETTLTNAKQQLENKRKNISKNQKQINNSFQKDSAKIRKKRIRIGEFRPVFFGVVDKCNVSIAFRNRFVVRDVFQHICQCDPCPLLVIFTKIHFMFICWGVCVGLFVIASIASLPEPVVILCFNLLIGGPLAFHFAQRSILKILVHHFEQETGHPVADPDLGLEKTVSRVSYTPIRVFVMEPHIKTEYLKNYWVEEVKRGEYMPDNWTPGPAQIQSVLNRHWAYHARKQDPLIPISQPDTTTAPSIADWAKAIALTALTGWFVFIIINKVTRKGYNSSNEQEISI